MAPSDGHDRGQLLLPDSPGPLTPMDAAAALITLPDKRYVLQRRDAKPSIFYPDHWGLFGGALEASETPKQALLRELTEELGLHLDARRPRYFSKFSFDVPPPTQRRLRRWFFHVELSEREWAQTVLGEGYEVGAFDLRTAFRTLRIVPYDEFALWLHGSRARLTVDPLEP